MTRTSFDGLTLTLLAALGLELTSLGCGSGSAGTTGDDSTSSTGSTGSTDTTDTTDSTTDTGTDTETGTDTTGEPTPVECINPTPVMQRDTEVPSGFYECENGVIHRVEAVECVAPEGPPDSPGCIDNPVCEASDNCQDRPYGGCTEVGDGADCDCRYGCASDADCDEGSICACAGVAGYYSRCIRADCDTSEGCTDGLCGLSFHDDGCEGFHMLACAGPDAECLVAADCEPQECSPGEYGDPECSAKVGEGFTCKTASCGATCGRPFFIAGEARAASSVARGDWCSASPTPRLTGLDPATRRRLARYWTRVASYEHASVASFARASLDLLALGAPPALILATRRALVDEIEHARLAYGLASVYAGRPSGPGALRIGGAVEGRVDPRVIVEGLVLEACVGETLAALEAREAAAWARDPAVASVLEQIAADELRHAELGWRTLRWILDQGDASLRAFALERLESAICEAGAASADEGVPPALRAHGLLDDELRYTLRRRALESSIAPCVAALRRHLGLGSAHQVRESPTLGS